MDAIRIDGMVILFSIAVVSITALVAGLIPAIVSFRVDLVSALRTGGHGITGASANRGRRTLVVAQVALAITVVAAAGLGAQRCQAASD